MTPQNSQLPSTAEEKEIVRELVRKAREAMKIYKNYTQEQVDEVVQAVAWAIMKPERAEELARVAVRDTGLGKVEDKVNKNRRKTLGTLRDLMQVKTVGVIREDPEKGIVEIAKPVGVVAAVVPSTNPAATPANKAMMALKGRNAIIFSPSPKGATTMKLLLRYIHEELAKVGAPLDLVQMLPYVNKGLTHELMQQADLVTVTGSANNVRAGQTSGKPNLCVSAGNVVSIVDASANIKEAARKIKLSKTYDYATSCSSDNSVVIEAAVYEQMLEAFKQEGGYLCTPEEKERLKAALWKEGKRRSETTCKPPHVIAQAAQLTHPDALNASFFMVEETEINPDNPFTREKLAVVLTVFKADNFDHAIDITQQILEIQGKGHSCGLHSTNKEHIDRIGHEIDVCRLLINQVQCFGNGGNFNNGLNFTLSMGGGTWAGNNIGENLSYKHFINITKVSHVIPEVIPDEEELLGSYFAKYGR